jgi:RNA polymerase sigma-70 factor (ECF subfamily)
MHPTDEALVAAYVERGDQTAFRTLVERHQDRVFGYVMGMVRDRATADDLFQETFIRVLRALNDERGSYTRQGKFLGWVLRIARNATLDHLRKRKKWRDVEDTEIEGSWWDRLPDQSPGSDDLLHQAEQTEILMACIDRLSPEQREVVLLRHETDLTFREIAELTGCSINTALGRMRYALMNLKKMMTTTETSDMTSAGA